MEAIFYMVYVDGMQGSTCKHLTRFHAELEAERLARLRGNEGKRVYLLAATNYCVAPSKPVIWSML